MLADVAVDVRNNQSEDQKIIPSPPSQPYIQLVKMEIFSDIFGQNEGSIRPETTEELDNSRVPCEIVLIDSFKNLKR